MSQIAHRNKFLSVKLKEETEEVKERVERERQMGGRAQRAIVWADADSVSEEEIERRNKALLYDE